MKVNQELIKFTQPNTVTGAAEQMEQAFLEEMLKYAGPKPAEGAFSGGVGEDQFSSFLTQSYAALLAESLDMGLAPQLEAQK